MKDPEPIFVSGDEYTRLVRELVSATEPLDIAVAFLGAGAESWLSKSNGGRLICNLESGATNPAVVRVLRDNTSFKVRSLSSLHAKVILSGDNVLCGSANISANGLGLESEEVGRWYEAGIFSHDASVIQACRTWFFNLWSKAIPINDNDLLAAETRWAARRFARPSGAPLLSSKGLFSHILTNPDFVLDRPIYLAVYREHASAEAVNAFELWKKSEAVADSATFDFYEDWSELPNNAYLIDIHCGPKGGVGSGGLYWTGPEKITKEFNYKESGTGEVRIVFKQKEYDGLRIIRRELDDFVNTITSIVRAMYSEKSIEEDSSAFCIPLASVMADIRSAAVTTEAE